MFLSFFFFILIKFCHILGNLKDGNLQNSPTWLTDEVRRACIPSIPSYVWLKNDVTTHIIHTHLGMVHEIQRFKAVSLTRTTVMQAIQKRNWQLTNLYWELDHCTFHNHSTEWLNTVWQWEGSWTLSVHLVLTIWDDTVKQSNYFHWDTMEGVRHLIIIIIPFDDVTKLLIAALNQMSWTNSRSRNYYSISVTCGKQLARLRTSINQFQNGEFM